MQIFIFREFGLKTSIHALETFCLLSADKFTLLIVFCICREAHLARVSGPPAMTRET